MIKGVFHGVTTGLLMMVRMKIPSLPSATTSWSKTSFSVMTDQLEMLPMIHTACQNLEKVSMVSKTSHARLEPMVPLILNKSGNGLKAQAETMKT